MSLFDESVVLTPAPRRRRTRRASIGFGALVVALVAMFVVSLLPSGFVIQQPGPVVNTLGESKNADGDEVPLIEIGGDQKVYPTGGTLSLVTVQVRGNRETRPSWFELATAWFDKSRAVVPVDALFPPDQTTEQREAVDQAMMVTSQDAAAAAALTEMGTAVGVEVVVASAPEADAPAHDLLKQGDVIRSVDGTAVKSPTDVTAKVLASEGKPVHFDIERDGTASTVVVTPAQADVDGKKVWRVGASVGGAYDLPFPIHIQLNDIGGPSAGMMFALGIIDVLTPGEMNGGKHIAGTGTIQADGAVGSIGGIRQKMYGAREAGNDWFLAPAANCNEVVGHIPDGLTVISTSTLAESVTAVEAIASGDGVDDLPHCTAG